MPLVVPDLDNVKQAIVYIGNQRYTTGEPILDMLAQPTRESWLGKHIYFCGLFYGYVLTSWSLVVGS